MPNKVKRPKVLEQGVLGPPGNGLEWKLGFTKTTQSGKIMAPHLQKAIILHILGFR